MSRSPSASFSSSANPALSICYTYRLTEVGIDGAVGTVGDWYEDF